ncbi:hypothetical protein ACWEQ4_01480 [Rhodococcus sp. NPDC003994]
MRAPTASISWALFRTVNVTTLEQVYTDRDGDQHVRVLASDGVVYDLPSDGVTVLPAA